MIQNLDAVAFQNLENPSPLSSTGKDPISDPDFNGRIRTSIMEAAYAEDQDNNAMIRNMRQAYDARPYEVSPGLDEYLSFLKTHYPDSPAAIIEANTKFTALFPD